MACDITVGRSRECKQALGGNSKLYLFNYIDTPFTIDEVLGEVTALSTSLTTVFEYDLVGDGHTLVENMVSNRTTGVTVNTQTLTVVLNKIDALTSVQMNLLAFGYPQAVILDRNGTMHCLGIVDGLDFTVDSATGAAHTDSNGYTLTGVAMEQTLSPKMGAATKTAFLALV